MKGAICRPAAPLATVPRTDGVKQYVRPPIAHVAPVSNAIGAFSLPDTRFVGGARPAQL